MQISPRYDGPPALVLELSQPDVSVPLLRQRQRLADELDGFDEAQWSTPSRCEGWTARDVVAHLVGTNQFWALSITAALGGAPTRFLASFDPVATPAQMVDATSAKSAAEVLADYVEANEALTAAVGAITDWSVAGEAPPGHVSLTAVCLHALWDAWIHERDILLPLGLTQTEEPDEVSGCLAYSSAIGPALAATSGERRSGTFCVAATNPAVDLTVTCGETVHVRSGVVDGAPRLSGEAVDLVEGLTYRAPLRHGLADEHAWMLAGLDAVFDQVG